MYNVYEVTYIYLVNVRADCMLYIYIYIRAQYKIAGISIESYYQYVYCVLHSMCCPLLAVLRGHRQLHLDTKITFVSVLSCSFSPRVTFRPGFPPRLGQYRRARNGYIVCKCLAFMT